MVQQYAWDAAVGCIYLNISSMNEAWYALGCDAQCGGGDTDHRILDILEQWCVTHLDVVTGTISSTSPPTSSGMVSLPSREGRELLAGL